GSGFATFAVLYLGDRLGDSAMSAATSSGAASVTFGNGGVGAPGTGRLIQTPLLSVVIARGQRFDQVFLLAGFTTPNVLVQAAGDLLTYERDAFRDLLCLAPAQTAGSSQAAPAPGGAAPSPPPGLGPLIARRCAAQ
ncbi:MAG TPA: hypothetical protein VKV34_05720, partial [Thermoleophilia bacterium]|nr:hypothetical protein [Thermoleophilia bacterium]